jgi:hypothetical protein
MDVVLAVAGIAIRGQRDFGDIPGDVARLAIETSVPPGQRVVRLCVVIKAPPAPIVRVVAKRTVRPKATFMMLVPVTGGAAQRRALEQQRAMTFLARHDGVAPDQRKSRDVVVEKRCSAPAGLSMALLATTAELAFVTVILAVTRHAGRRQLVAIEIACVARIALDLRMRGSQWKFCRLVMIEANRAPLALVVAAFAFGAVPSGVDILNPVAIHTCGADILVAFANMARGAGDGTMCTLERELRAAVVERFDAKPCRLAVTIVACFPKTPLMRIVRLVTVEAASGRVAKLCRLRVTVDARYCRVGVPEIEIRKRVIEGLAVELDNVGTSALMICVTMGTFLFRCIRLTPVKSAARPTVCDNFLVAREAEPRLRSGRERLVTVGALLLELGMSGDDRPGHDELFE